LNSGAWPWASARWRLGVGRIGDGATLTMLMAMMLKTVTLKKKATGSVRGVMNFEER
jgi:hypothetical protein